MNGEEMIETLEETFEFDYKTGKKMAKFIDFLLRTLPEESYEYKTSKESYIQDQLETILDMKAGNE